MGSVDNKMNVAALVQQMHDNLSEIHKTIAGLSTNDHDARLDELEKKRDSLLEALWANYEREKQELTAKRQAEIAEIAEKRRIEDEERERHRRQEDEELQARNALEDEERQGKFDSELNEVDDEIEPEMDVIEEEARKLIEGGQERLRSLEEKRRELNRMIDEQLKMPLPQVSKRQRRREKNSNGVPPTSMSTPAPEVDQVHSSSNSNKALEGDDKVPDPQENTRSIEATPVPEAKPNSGLFNRITSRFVNPSSRKSPDEHEGSKPTDEDAQLGTNPDVKKHGAEEEEGTTRARVADLSPAPAREEHETVPSPELDSVPALEQLSTVVLDKDVGDSIQFAKRDFESTSQSSDKNVESLNQFSETVVPHAEGQAGTELEDQPSEEGRGFTSSHEEPLTSHETEAHLVETSLLASDELHPHDGRMSEDVDHHDPMVGSRGLTKHEEKHIPPHNESDDGGRHKFEPPSAQEWPAEIQIRNLDEPTPHQPIESPDILIKNVDEDVKPELQARNVDEEPTQYPSENPKSQSKNLDDEPAQPSTEGPEFQARNLNEHEEPEFQVKNLDEQFKEPSAQMSEFQIRNLDEEPPSQPGQSLELHVKNLDVTPESQIRNLNEEREAPTENSLQVSQHPEIAPDKPLEVPSGGEAEEYIQASRAALDSWKPSNEQDRISLSQVPFEESRSSRGLSDAPEELVYNVEAPNENQPSPMLGDGITTTTNVDSTLGVGETHSGPASPGGSISRVSNLKDHQEPSNQPGGDEHNIEASRDIVTGDAPMPSQSPSIESPSHQVRRNVPHEDDSRELPQGDDQQHPVPREGGLDMSFGRSGSLERISSEAVQEEVSSPATSRSSKRLTLTDSSHFVIKYAEPQASPTEERHYDPASGLDGDWHPHKETGRDEAYENLTGGHHLSSSSEDGFYEDFKEGLHATGHEHYIGASGDDALMPQDNQGRHPPASPRSPGNFHDASDDESEAGNPFDLEDQIQTRGLQQDREVFPDEHEHPDGDQHGSPGEFDESAHRPEHETHPAEPETVHHDDDDDDDDDDDGHHFASLPEKAQVPGDDTMISGPSLYDELGQDEQAPKAPVASSSGSRSQTLIQDVSEVPISRQQSPELAEIRKTPWWEGSPSTRRSSTNIGTSSIVTKGDWSDNHQNVGSDGGNDHDAFTDTFVSHPTAESSQPTTMEPANCEHGESVKNELHAPVSLSGSFHGDQVPSDDHQVINASHSQSPAGMVLLADEEGHQISDRDGNVEATELSCGADIVPGVAQGESHELGANDLNSYLSTDEHGDHIASPFSNIEQREIDPPHHTEESLTEPSFLAHRDDHNTTVDMSHLGHDLGHSKQFDEASPASPIAHDENSGNGISRELLEDGSLASIPSHEASHPQNLLRNMRKSEDNDAIAGDAHNKTRSRRASEAANNMNMSLHEGQDELPDLPQAVLEDDPPLPSRLTSGLHNAQIVDDEDDDTAAGDAHQKILSHPDSEPLAIAMEPTSPKMTYEDAAERNSRLSQAMDADGDDDVDQEPGNAHEKILSRRALAASIHHGHQTQDDEKQPPLPTSEHQQSLPAEDFHFLEKLSDDDSGDASQIISTRRASERSIHHERNVHELINDAVPVITDASKGVDHDSALSSEVDSTMWDAHDEDITLGTGASHDATDATQIDDHFKPADSRGDDTVDTQISSRDLAGSDHDPQDNLGQVPEFQSKEHFSRTEEEQAGNEGHYSSIHKTIYELPRQESLDQTDFIATAQTLGSTDHGIAPTVIEDGFAMDNVTSAIGQTVPIVNPSDGPHDTDSDANDLYSQHDSKSQDRSSHQDTIETESQAATTPLQSERPYELAMESGLKLNEHLSVAAPIRQGNHSHLPVDNDTVHGEADLIADNPTDVSHENQKEYDERDFEIIPNPHESHDDQNEDDDDLTMHGNLVQAPHRFLLEEDTLIPGERYTQGPSPSGSLNDEENDEYHNARSAFVNTLRRRASQDSQSRSQADDFENESAQGTLDQTPQEVELPHRAEYGEETPRTAFPVDLGLNQSGIHESREEQDDDEHLGYYDQYENDVSNYATPLNEPEEQHEKPVYSEPKGGAMTPNLRPATGSDSTTDVSPFTLVHDAPATPTRGGLASSIHAPRNNPQTPTRQTEEPQTPRVSETEPDFDPENFMPRNVTDLPWHARTPQSMHSQSTLSSTHSSPIHSALHTDKHEPVIRESWPVPIDGTRPRNDSQQLTSGGDDEFDPFRYDAPKPQQAVFSPTTNTTSIVSPVRDFSNQQQQPAQAQAQAQVQAPRQPAPITPTNTNTRTSSLTKSHMFQKLRSMFEAPAAPPTEPSPPLRSRPVSVAFQPVGRERSSSLSKSIDWEALQDAGGDLGRVSGYLNEHEDGIDERSALLHSGVAEN